MNCNTSDVSFTDFYLFADQNLASLKQSSNVNQIKS